MDQKLDIKNYDSDNFGPFWAMKPTKVANQSFVLGQHYLIKCCNMFLVFTKFPTNCMCESRVTFKKKLTGGYF